MIGKNDLLMYSLQKFYKKKNNLQVMLDLLEGEEKISLRVIDWFVTNYAKKKNTILCTKGTKKRSDNYLIVYLNYKAQLKAYSKKQFDPFCRRNRIEFLYDNEKKILTTVGQLNFFRWFIQNNLCKYIRNHLLIIEKDMNKSLSKTYSSVGRKKRKQRKELSKSATNTINKYNLHVVFEFS